MDESPVEEISENSVHEMYEQRKDTMGSKLSVVLREEAGAQPVLNTGSLYT